MSGMAEFASDVTEEEETAAANVAPTCDKRHCREMRKEKLPPYLRDRGMNFSSLRKRCLSKKEKKSNFRFVVYYHLQFCDKQDEIDNSTVIFWIYSSHTVEEYVNIYFFLLPMDK